MGDQSVGRNKNRTFSRKKMYENNWLIYSKKKNNRHLAGWSTPQMISNTMVGIQTVHRELHQMANIMKKSASIYEKKSDQDIYLFIHSHSSYLPK